MNYIKNISPLEENFIGNLKFKQKPIKANNQILNIHTFYLNKSHQLQKIKQNPHISPFSLFSNIAPSRASFNISITPPNHLTTKISEIGQHKTPKTPFQEFIQSFSISQTESKKPGVIDAINNDIITTPSIKVTETEVQKISVNNESNIQFTTEVLGVVSENSEFKTLRLKRPKDWSFQPGQYLEIKSTNNPAKKPAILAIASGMNDDYIEITGKPNANPEHANFLLNSLVGDSLTINGPLGTHFPLELITDESKVFVLGGGSGITALKSLMESMPDVETKLIYTSKTFKELIYNDEIEKWKTKGHIISLTKEQKENYAQGRISDLLKPEEINSKSLFFLCGPKQLVLETAKVLISMGVPKESIFGSLPVLAKDGGPVFRGDHPIMNLA